jgi:hypothetical protein
VNANIQITPPSAANPVGTNHVLTITINAIGGTIDAGSHTATASIVSGPGSFVGPNTCTYTGGAATASCTVTITSATTGTTVVSATSDIPVGGQTIARTTGTAANLAAGGSDNASKFWGDSNIVTHVRNAANADITNTTVAPGTVIHDEATVTKASGTPAGAPAPAGTVTFTLYSTGTCTGPVLATDANKPLAGGVATSATFTAPSSGGSFSYLAHYNGDANYPGHDAACEPFAVSAVDANIQITPPTAVNATGTNHTLTAHVNVNEGSGFVNAPSGTLITFSKVSGPGSFVGGVNTCTTIGATGSCSVQITSSATGTTVVRAATDVVVVGTTLHRETGDANAGDSTDAQKEWVDAKIDITPATADNPVGTNHVLTITVTAINGTIDAGPHTATASIASGPGSFVGSPTCTYQGGAATASCIVTITSATAGTTTVSATSNIPVKGQPITRTTGTAANTASGGSGNAAKNWADSTIVTHVRNAANADVTNQTVPAGSVVHDEATVGKTAATPASVPAPTGTVTFTLYSTGTCTGTVLATDANKPLNAGGVATSVNFTTPGGGGSFSYLAHYNGDANYPGHDAACEPFDVETPPAGLITETNVACGDVLSGAAVNSVIDAVNYPSSKGSIGNGINPGKFYFWTKITTTTPNQVVTVTQANNSTNNAALFGIHQGWARIYTGNCASWTAGTEINNGSGARFTVPTPGTYFIGIKYDPKTLVGTRVPVPATITYTFTTSLGGNSGASVKLRPS